MMKKILLSLGTSLIVIALALPVLGCAKSSETEKYARELGLPKQVQTAVRELEYDKNNPNDYTKLLLDKLCYLPKELQVHQVTMDYLKDVAEDKKVSAEEYSILLNDKLDHDRDGLDLATENKLKTDPLKPNPEVKQAIDYLKSISESTLDSYMKLGLDGDALLRYITLVSTLPKDFADYAIKSRLCIQDKKLTEPDKQFLKEPDKYTQQMYEYNISEISKIDPELMNKMKIIPLFKGMEQKIEVKDVEATEDVLYLAMQPEGKTDLEKIYGKGIERKMWPVALEKLIWDSYSNELEVSDLGIHLRLADFQAKYNKEMDMEGVSGPKPAIRGINLLSEPLGWLVKNDGDAKFDYALIRWGLRCNAVRLYCDGTYGAFYHAKLAQSEGLDTWLLFFPLFGSGSNIDKESYKNYLANIAKKANQNNIIGLFVGAEFDAWWSIWGGTNYGTPTQYNLNNDQLKKYIDILVKIVRENYSGQITYQEWDGWYGFDKNLNWNIMDVVSPTAYIGSHNNQFLNNQLYFDTFRNIKTKYNKPLVIAESGSLTISESEKAGGHAEYIKLNPYHYDPEKQAKVIDRHLNLLYKVGVNGIFVFEWDELANHPWGDMNKFGFGIWDYVKKEPKPSFWTVYKYYKE